MSDDEDDQFFEAFDEVPQLDVPVWVKEERHMRTPPDFRLLSVRGSRLAGVHRGEFDVQRVLVFGLERGDGG